MPSPSWEFFDAELRATASGELRNNDKAHDPRSEWGQAGYMIASALIQSTNIEPMPENYTVTPYGFDARLRLCVFQF